MFEIPLVVRPGSCLQGTWRQHFDGENDGGDEENERIQNPHFRPGGNLVLKRGQ
jgi:hypothetical protein